MRLIVFSRVLKYRAIFIGIVLLLTLAFFQSSQSLGESSPESNIGNSTSSDSGTPETPSTPETPFLPENPDLPGSSDSTTRVSISIKTTTNTNNSDVDSESEEETTFAEIKKEVTNGSIRLTFTSNGEEQNIKEKIEDEIGKTSVKFKTKSNTNSTNEISQETTIEKEISTH